MLFPHAEPIKEGHVAVRGHFMWRERYVVVLPGLVVIHRANKGAVKAKIDLLEPSVRIVFHEDHTQLTVSTHGLDTIFQCHSTAERDAWVSAVFMAKGGHGGDTDCESSDLVQSTVEECVKERLLPRTSEHDSMDTDGSDDDSVYSEALLAFQGLRNSMMTLIETSYDESSSLVHRSSLTASVSDENTTRQRHLTAIVDLIRSKEHGGRVVLLHLDVISTSMGNSLEDIVLALGEKQRDKQQRALTSSSSSASAAAGLQRLHISTFVRYILFHPLYSSRQSPHHSSQVDLLIDQYFPHCRLRRFSHDVDHCGSSIHSIEIDHSQRQQGSRGYDDAGSPLTTGAIMPHTSNTSTVRVATASMTKAESRLKQKRHSFPNIMMSIPIGPLLSSARQESNSRLPIPMYGKRRASDQLVPVDVAEAEESNDSSLFQDEVIPQPLRTVLWRYSPQDVAEQLSIFHQDQLNQLTLSEFIQSPQQALKPITDHFNRLVSFLVWSVLVEDSAKDRAEVIEWIISIASAASATPVNNFHLVMACVGCLGDTPLMASRLPATWKRVRAKSKAQLVQLRALCDHAGGFEALRKRQLTEAAKGVCIPFVGVIGVALERLRLVPYLTEDFALDVDKLERQYAVVTTIENAMLRQYKTASIDSLHTWIQHRVPTIDSFVTPRLLQLRSQHVLALETQQSYSRHSSLHRTRNSSSHEGPTVDKAASDPGPPMLTFRDICSILATAPDLEDRIRICVEVVVADDRQPSAARLRKFLQDFRQSACVSNCHLVLANVRSCIERISQEILTHKLHEVLQLTGMEEGSIQLQRSLYCIVAEAVTRPVAAWLSTKVKHTFAAEDAKVLGRIREWRQELANGGTQHPSICIQLRRGATPVDMVQAFADALDEEPCQDTRIHRCLELLSSSPCNHPFSLVFLMQQSLDAIPLPKKLRETLELLDETLSRVAKRPSNRASLARSSTSISTASCKCLRIQPPELVSMGLH